MKKHTICRRCGACCRTLLLEADLLDAAREPLIAQRGSPVKGLDGRVESYCLNADGPDHRCVAFGPGDERCGIA